MVIFLTIKFKGNYLIYLIKDITVWYWFNRDSAKKLVKKLLFTVIVFFYESKSIVNTRYIDGLTLKVG